RVIGLPQLVQPGAQKLVKTGSLEVGAVRAEQADDVVELEILDIIEDFLAAERKDVRVAVNVEPGAHGFGARQPSVCAGTRRRSVKGHVGEEACLGTYGDPVIDHEFRPAVRLDPRDSRSIRQEIIKYDAAEAVTDHDQGISSRSQPGRLRQVRDDRRENPIGHSGNATGLPPPEINEDVAKNERDLLSQWATDKAQQDIRYGVRNGADEIFHPSAKPL